MEVKPGYKQTEMGVIPEEWETRALKEITSYMLQGVNTAIDKPEYVLDGIPMLKANNIIDGEVIFDGADHISPRTFSGYSDRFKAKKDDFLFSNIGARLGTGSLLKQDVECSFAWNVMRIVPDTRKIIPEYLCFLINSPKYSQEIKGKQSGSGMGFVPKSVMQKLTVALPKRLEEQQVIATVLSDVDALLGGLDRLIAKKRDLKQAAMQQLLTGHTRLPGFRGEWEAKTLGDLGSTFGGLTGKTKADFGDGAAQYVTFMNIMTNVVIDCGIFERVRVSPTESQNRVMKGDLLFNGSSETPEEVAMCAVLMSDVPSLFLNSFCFGFRFRDNAEADGLFLAYYLRNSEGRELMKSLAQGSTRYNLSKVALLKAPLRLPSLPEQTAIATVLSDMDVELSALEARRSKTRDLKQAMMQELLTGKTRLVTVGGANA